jgi:hypothetical protein
MEEMASGTTVQEARVAWRKTINTRFLEYGASP